MKIATYSGGVKVSAETTWIRTGGTLTFSLRRRYPRAPKAVLPELEREQGTHAPGITVANYRTITPIK
jgi:hypothetical protein